MIEFVTIRQAQLTEVQTVADMWTRASERLKSKGLDQWQYPVKVERITQAVHSKKCWLVQHHDTNIATITLDPNAEPTYWYAEDHPTHALYAHRMVVSESAQGRELGSSMLDWASHKSQQQDKTWLRLDAWRTNRKLHQYYLDHGFELVRIIDDPREVSGACFQRKASIQLGHGPKIHEI